MRDPEIESVCLSRNGEPGSGSILVLSRSLYQVCVFESWGGVFEKAARFCTYSTAITYLLRRLNE